MLDSLGESNLSAISLNGKCKSNMQGITPVCHSPTVKRNQNLHFKWHSAYFSKTPFVLLDMYVKFLKGQQSSQTCSLKISGQVHCVSNPSASINLKMCRFLTIGQFYYKPRKFHNKPQNNKPHWISHLRHFLASWNAVIYIIISNICDCNLHAKLDL